MVYDITNRYTFDDIRDYWSEQIKEHCPPETIIIIAGNKAHLYEKEQVDENEAREFASLIIASLVLVSTKNIISVNELFFEIARKYSGCEDILVIDDKYETDFKPIKKKEVNEINKPKETIKIKIFGENNRPKKNGCFK